MPLTRVENRGRRKSEKVTPVVFHLESTCVLPVAWQEKGPQEFMTEASRSEFALRSFAFIGLILLC